MKNTPYAQDVHLLLTIPRRDNPAKVGCSIVALLSPADHPSLLFGRVLNMRTEARCVSAATIVFCFTALRTNSKRELPFQKWNAFLLFLCFNSPHLNEEYDDSENVPFHETARGGTSNGHRARPETASIQGQQIRSTR